MRSREERRNFGKSHREAVHRVDQCRWDGRKAIIDAVEVIVASSEGRLAELLPIKFGRMAASPFGFFRGAVPLMAADLATLPVSGLTTQICGDAHVRNLGAYAAPDGRLIFDINDFDETIPGPWEWDVKRLATSLVLAGREAQDSEKTCKEAVLTFVQSYRAAMEELSKLTVLDLARYQVHRHLKATPISAVLKKAERATPSHNLEKLTTAAKGGRKFKESKPLITHVPKETAQPVLGSLVSYRETLLAERQHFFDLYRPLDVVFKVVGTGSVGTRDYVVLCLGNDEGDALFLQVKEEPPSAYAASLPQAKVVSHQGRRVAEGQRRMQAQSDLFLGWTSIAGRDYLVRQLSDHKAGIETEDLKGQGLSDYATVCGEVLAKGHARSGDACAIAGYCGSSDKLDKAVAKFAAAYADQTASDHHRLVAAIQRGKLKAKMSSL